MWNSLHSLDSNGNYTLNGSVHNSVAGGTDSLWPNVCTPKPAAGSTAPFHMLYRPEQYADHLSPFGGARFEFEEAVFDTTKPPLPPTAANDHSSSSLFMSGISELLSYDPESSSANDTSSLIMSQINEILRQNDAVAPVHRPFDGGRTDCGVGVERSNNDRALSTEDVMRAAAFHFIQMSPQREEIPPLLRRPFGLLISGLTAVEINNVELANTLLAVAEKVSNLQCPRASSLLQQCYRFSSDTGNPVERVVYYFSRALHERILRESGRLPWIDGKHEGSDPAANSFVGTTLSHHHPVHLIAHYALPFPQILQFTSVQAILDKVASSKRIHMIDLSIGHGLQWTILMHALAARVSCQVVSLKISAVGSSWEAMADTGSRLSSFAGNLQLPFKFVTVVVPNLKDLREDSFELDDRDAVGIYSGQAMSSLIATPDRLDNLMRVIQKLKPAVMTVSDVEAKHNSPSFISRFTEALFYYSALFDCLDSTMEREDANRMALERVYYSQAVRSIVAAEGSEREVRHVGIDVWRRFFMRFGLVEAELSEWSLYQAGVLLKQFEKGECCTMEKDGKSLLVGWKGTPVNFVSAWKFQRGEGKLLRV